MAGKDTVATYGIDVQTGESVDQVDVLAKGLQSLRDEMRADKSELAAMNKAMSDLKKGGKDFEGQAKALKVQIEAQSAKIALATTKYQALGGKLTEVGKAAVKPKQEFSAMRQVLAKLQEQTANTNGAVGQAVGGLTKLWQEVDTSKLRVVALAGVLALVTGALIVFTKHMYESAVAAQDARRSELLHLEALTKQRNFYGLAAGSAKEMQQAIDRVSATTSINRSEVTALGTQLYNSGVRGKNFATILEASAIKASALGSAAGSAFAGFATDIARAGGSAARAAQDVKNRFGGVVQAQMKSLEVQTRKAKENFDTLFAGIDIEPLLDAKKGLNDMVSTATASGRAFQSLASQFLQPIVNLVTSSLVVVRRFYKQMLIGVLELVQAYLIVRVWFHKTFGGPEVQSVLGKFFTLLKPGRILVYMLAVAFGFLAFNVLAATWPFVLGAVAVWGLFEVINDLVALFTEIDWHELGKSIVNGIVEPIIKAEDWIVEKVSNLGTAIKDAFSSVLGIASPSKVFAELGLAIPQGVVAGIAKGEPDAKRAAGGIVDKPIALPPTPAAPGAPAAPAARSGTTTNTFTINIEAPSDKAQDIARALRRELESLLGGMAEQLGAPRGEPTA